MFKKFAKKCAMVGAGLVASGVALADGDVVSGATTALSNAQAGATTTGSNIPAIVGVIVLVGIVVAMMKKA